MAAACAAAVLVAAGCGGDDDEDSPAGPPPLATESIGAYEFDSPEVAQQADEARRATARYLDEKLARDDGYDPQPSAENPVCNDPAGRGDGGIEYLNEGLIDEEPDIRSPAVLYYEPDEFGGRRLTALQYRVPEGTSGAELFGQPVDPTLTVWLFLYNPNGLFEDGNVTSKCPPGPPPEPPPPPPRRGGGPPGGGPPPGAEGGGGPPPGATGGGPPPGATGGGPPPGQ
jgi:hypothetical protein